VSAGRLLAAVVLLSLGSWPRHALASGPDSYERVYDAALLLATAGGSEAARLSELGERPLLILPVFTRCRTTCGLMVTRLRSAWGDVGPAGSRAQVLIVSFDSEDTREDLLSFREMYRLPGAWKLATLARDEGTRFFSSLAFQWLTLDDRQFDHAGKLYVLTGSRRIAAVLGPDQLTAERLGAEVDAALQGPSLARRIGSHWIGLFGVGIVISGLLAAVAWDRLRSGHARPA
jgi:cytochrome oxidase Cu insertion factor (SCO1/SenC/PrrC family)